MSEAIPSVQRSAVTAARRTLTLIALVCAAPIVAALLAFYVWPPGQHMNHGELLAARAPVAFTRLDYPDGASAAALSGRWVLLQVAPAACEAACSRALYHMRQVRLAQGADMERIARLWLVSDGSRPAAGLLADHAGLVWARAAADDARANVEPPLRPGELLLLDPRGNPVLRYATDADPRGLVRDLQRLLKYTRQG